MRGLKPIRIKLTPRQSVASFTDAWIETAYIRARKDEILSHLLQMRGLKPFRTASNRGGGMSHLLQMRGLKLTIKQKRIITSSRIFYRCVD